MVPSIAVATGPGNRRQPRWRVWRVRESRRLLEQHLPAGADDEERDIATRDIRTETRQRLSAGSLLMLVIVAVAAGLGGPPRDPAASARSTEVTSRSSISAVSVARVTRVIAAPSPSSVSTSTTATPSAMRVLRLTAAHPPGGLRLAQRVPHAAHGADQPRVAVVQLAPQVADVRLDAGGLDGVAIVPDVLDDLRPREDTPGVVHQVAQQAVLGRRELDLPSPRQTRWASSSSTTSPTATRARRLACPRPRRSIASTRRTSSSRLNGLVR